MKKEKTAVATFVFRLLLDWTFLRQHKRNQNSFITFVKWQGYPKSIKQCEALLDTNGYGNL